MKRLMTALGIGICFCADSWGQVSFYTPNHTLGVLQENISVNSTGQSVSINVEAWQSGNYLLQMHFTDGTSQQATFMKL